MQKAQKKIARKKKDLVTKHFKAWKIFLKNILPAKRKQEELKETFIKKRLLNVWKTQLQLKLRLKSSLEDAVNLYHKNLTKRVVKHLAKLKQKKKQLHFYKNALTTKHQTLTTNKFFSTWSNLFQKITKTRKQEQEHRKGELTIYFGAWKTFDKEAKRKKTRNIRLERHLERVTQAQVENVLFGWFNYVRLKKRNQGVLELFAARKRLGLYKAVFYELVKGVKVTLRQKVAKMESKSAYLEANIRDNIQHVEEIDAEKIELRNNATLFQEEIAKLNIQIDERDREIVN